MLYQRNLKPSGLFGQFAPTGANMTPAVDPRENIAQGFAQTRAAAPQPVKKPGMFGEGGFGRHMAGYLGDMLMQNAGFDPIYQPVMQQKNLLAERARMQEAQRQAQRDDFLFQEEYKRNNPAPVNNDTVNDYEFIRQTRGQEAANSFLQNVYDPVVNIQLGNGASYVGPRSQMPSAIGGAQGGNQDNMPVVEDGHQYTPGPGGRANPQNWKPVGGASSNAGSGFPVKGNFGGFKRAIIAQESGGRYGIPNAEGSGAMGIGQVMPDTGKALAKRIGLPWRPDLMRGNSPEARQYQDRITDAALQEAWEYGGGDIRKAAHYYFAGPDKKGWGRKTYRYGDSIVRRVGGN